MHLSMWKIQHRGNRRDTEGSTCKLPEAACRNSITTSGNDVSEDTLSKKITVTQIRYITVENETYVYITAKDRSVYKQNFADNESLIKIEEGDVITVHYMEGDDGVNTLFLMNNKFE